MRFWDASGVCLRLLYKLSTVRVFLTDSEPSDSTPAPGEDEWPPLRKVRLETLEWGDEVGLEGPLKAALSRARWAPLIPTVMTPAWASRRSSSANTAAT